MPDGRILCAASMAAALNSNATRLTLGITSSLIGPLSLSKAFWFPAPDGLSACTGFPRLPVSRSRRLRLGRYRTAQHIPGVVVRVRDRRPVAVRHTDQSAGVIVFVIARVGCQCACKP